MAEKRKQGKLDSFVVKKEENGKKEEEHEEDENKKPHKKTKKTEETENFHVTRHEGLYGKKDPFDTTAIGGDFQNTPLHSLESAISMHTGRFQMNGAKKNVLMWIRNKDLRMTDNRALWEASLQAKKNGTFLIVLYIVSPGDYKSHERSTRRVDFILRNLKDLKEELNGLYIPLVVNTVEPRKQVPEKILEYMKKWEASHLFANLEYEVDELRRDQKVVELFAKEDNLSASFHHDCLVVPPGVIKSKDGKPYSIYKHWFNGWLTNVKSSKKYLERSPDPHANSEKIFKDEKMSELLKCSQVPNSVKGFECEDVTRMEQMYPAGYKVAKEILEQFASRKALLNAFERPLDDLQNKEEIKEKTEIGTRLKEYRVGRDQLSINGTSRLSPYLAAGVISSRECVNRAKELNGDSLDVGGKENGISCWIQELAWRDFYSHVLAAWPRVSMGRAYNLNTEGIVWEKDEKKIQAWKEGKTGFPIIDAAMKQLNETGYMHNRCRMIVASFFTKDLMVDWRIGESYFMTQLIDGDLASNNGGWQWSASTGTDPQPYFRIFNPCSQSEKFDPEGVYIKHWLPQLNKLDLKKIHNPERISQVERKALNFPSPIVNHAESRIRALRRYKNPGIE